MRSLILRIADTLFDTKKPVYILLYSPSKDKYKTESFVDHMLDNRIKFINSEDEDWQIITASQSKEKLRVMKVDLINRRHEKANEVEA